MPTLKKAGYPVQPYSILSRMPSRNRKIGRVRNKSPWFAFGDGLFVLVLARDGPDVEYPYA